MVLRLEGVKRRGRRGRRGRCGKKGSSLVGQAQWGSTWLSNPLVNVPFSESCRVVWYKAKCDSDIGDEIRLIWGLIRVPL